MNVQGLKQTIVTTTLCVTTSKDRTSVSVLADIMVMVETAQVNISFFIFLACYILQSIPSARNLIKEKRKLLLKVVYPDNGVYLNYSKTIQFDPQLDLFY